MKPLFAFAPHWCLLSLITASPHSKNAAAKRTEIGSGCAWCTPDPWTIDSGEFLVPRVFGKCNKTQGTNLTPDSL